MEVRRDCLPTPRGSRLRDKRLILLEAIHVVNERWERSGRLGTPRETARDPMWRAEIAAEAHRIRERERQRPRDPEVAEVVAIEEAMEDGRKVSRALARWNDDLVAEALGWYTDAIVIEAHELIGKNAEECQRLMLDRLRGRPIQ